MTREYIEQEALRIIQHKTLEEHAATQLMMNTIDKYTAEKVLEARIDELEKSHNVHKETTLYFNSLLPYKSFNEYSEQRSAELQAELSKLKEEE